MNVIAINTSQNVNLDFSLASIGDRMAAFFIDTVIRGSYVVLLVLFFTYVISIDDLSRTWDNWSLMAFFGIVLLPIELYTLVFESLMEGQTPGKKMMNIKVVKIDGYQASFSDYLVRWFFRLVDILISSSVVGIISVIISKNNQRLGGMASGTAVISLKNKVQINHTIIEDLHEEYKPQFQQVLALSDHDVQIIKSNYQKAIHLREYQVVTRLAEKIREITQIPDQRPDMTEQQFIEKIIKDYSYYTGQDM